MDPTRHEYRIQTICLLIVSTVAVAAALYWLQPVLVPFVLAVFIAYGLLPLVEFQVHRLRLPYLVAVASTLVIGVLILGSLGLLISTSVSQLQANAAAYQQQIELLGAKVSVLLQPARSAPKGTRSPNCPSATSAVCCYRRRMP